jgi:hypothetical protein
LSNGAFKGSVWVYALAVGTSAELFLRSSFYIKQTTKEGGGGVEVLRGPLDLLKWYQNLVLFEMVSTRLAAKRLVFVRTNLPNGDFQTLCTIVQNNLEAWPDEDGRTTVDAKIAELREAFERERARSATSAQAAETLQLDEMYRRKLGYAVLNAGGQTIFKTLFS